MIVGSFTDSSFGSMSTSTKGSVPPPMNPPLLTAFSWCLTDADNGETLWGKGADERLEIASLTKIMTACAVLKIMRLLKLDPSTATLIVPNKAVGVIGTTAGLYENDKLSVDQLLYGLMLPSGNDAALTLAEGCGRLLISGCDTNKALKSKLKTGLRLMTVKNFSKVNPTEMFIRCMNMLACKLGLLHTFFSNPHGLADKTNKSTSGDIGKLVCFARKDELISRIVKTRDYKCSAATLKGEQREYNWSNTNSLLKEGYDGFKTGITPTAGPCLVGTKKYRDINLIITVLHCKSCEHRWKEINAIYGWAAHVIDSIYDNCVDDTINLKKIASLFHRII